MALRNSNIEIVDAVRNDASLSYRDRVPAANQAGMRAVSDNIFSARTYVNEFTDALINRIATSVGRGLTWHNPLSIFKGQKIEYGSQVQEYHVNLLHEYSYNVDEDENQKVLFGQHLPDVESIFHTIDRQGRYDLTINYDILRRAFLDEGGLSDFVSKLMGTVESSDNWDEFLYMTRLFSQYHDKQGFFYKKIPDVENSQDMDKDAKEFLRTLREYASILKFPSKKYNAARRHVFADKADLVAFVTPRVKSIIDVNGLSAAFNRSDSNPDIVTIEIPQDQFDLGGQVHGILTTRDFFRVHDTLIENTSMDNPAGLWKNYFFHHHEIISNSLFVPAIAFTSGDQSTTQAIKLVNPSALVVKLADGVTPPLKPGDTVQLVGDLTADLSSGNTKLPGIMWEIVSAVTSPATRVTQEGVLHISRTEKAKEITVRGTIADSAVSDDSDKIAVTPAVETWAIKH